ncbi:MAG: hypothetical protein FWE36_04105 [Erysipelotrichales bacterium]|nr:hypothetical protein [Erysipelotrichales bacterium]
MKNLKKIKTYLLATFMITLVLTFSGCDDYDYSSNSEYYPPTTETTEPEIHSPVGMARARVQGATGNGGQVILQFTLLYDFEFGTVETEFNAETWLEYNELLAELADGKMTTTTLQNDIVFFARSDGEKITSVRNRYWAGYLNIQKQPDSRDDSVSLSGSNHNRILEKSKPDQVYENAGGLISSNFILSESWEVVLMVIENGYVFRHIVIGTGNGPNWAKAE